MATEEELDQLERELMDMMDEDDEYSELSAAEGGEYLEAYQEEEEFPLIEEESPIEGEIIEPDYTFSYEQLEHVAGGKLGTVFGGKFEKIEQILEAQITEKSELWLRKLSVDLREYFSPNRVAGYVEVMRKVPRFWVMNSPAVAATIFLIEQLKRAGVEINRRGLRNVSERTGVPKEDLFRYYRLLEKYVE